LKTPGITAAAENPLTVGEIALYVGPDRENILIKGAKKEGQLVFYNSNTWMNNVISREFEKKYPFIKVQALRSGSEKLIKRIMEEYAAQHYIADVMESRVGYKKAFCKSTSLRNWLITQKKEKKAEKPERTIVVIERVMSVWALIHKRYHRVKRRKHIRICSIPNGGERSQSSVQPQASYGWAIVRTSWVRTLLKS